MEFSAVSIPEAYVDGLWKLRIFGVQEGSRNGPMITIPEPVTLTIRNPKMRVLSDATRNANPFFHVMETVWMFAGRNNPTWLLQFNKRIGQYADKTEFGSIINGAYGYRWLVHWGPQISYLIQLLKEEPTTRQAVLNMWDPSLDLFQRHWKDRPCNTHIYFRIVNGALNMTVCNRSNDFVWGMMGANAVHMTYLHELVALATDNELGVYRVFTNNLHFYLNQYQNTKDLLDTLELDWVYPRATLPILAKGESWERFLLECKMFIDGKFDGISNKWLKGVAMPMYHSYLLRGQNFVKDIEADDWRECCRQWLARNRG